MDDPVSMGLMSAAGELKMPFSDPVKYCILGISVLLLLLSVGILTWEAYRCYTHAGTTYTQPAAMNGNLLFPDDKSTTAGLYRRAPSSKVDNVDLEVYMLSHCLSQASFPSSESSQVDGSLRFSVYYDQQQCRLVVTVLKVDGLKKQSQTRSLKPFVKLRLMWTSEGEEVEGCIDEKGEGMPPVLCTVLQEWRTRIVKGSCSPLFGDQFSCILQDHNELHHIKLRMEVRDFDKFSRHTVLGEVRVPLGQLNISYPLEIQQDLQTPQKDLVGEVLLSLKFLPTSQRLEVGLLKVRTAPTEISSDAALYARISVQCNHSKLRYQKTSSVGRSMVTVFNEVLIFSLPEFPLEKCKILVSVYQTHTTIKPTKNLIGQLTVRKEKSAEDKHWGLMMRSVRQPVAKWHGLLI